MRDDSEDALSSSTWSDRDPVAYHAALHAKKVACVDLPSGAQFTYRELDELCARTAGLLSSTLSNPRGGRIAVVARNSLDHLLVAYACERIGAIYVPLNWRLSGPELAVLLEDAEPEALIYDSEFEAAAMAGAAGRRLNAIWRLAPGANPFRQAVLSSSPVSPSPAPLNAPATLLYTSGTTGRPKGVVITRQNAFFASFNFTALGEVGPQSTLLCEAPMFHTVGLFAVARTAVFNGARLLISDRFTPAATLDRLADPRLGVTHYFGVPQMAQAIADQPGFASADLSGLKGFFVGGAPLPQPLARAYVDKGVPISNGYGMSEAGSVLHLPLDLDVIRSKSRCVGVPGPAVDVRLVTADALDAAPGEVGEIWVRGPAVTPGYWNQPEATARAFSGDWFRTGDAARQDEDGFYEIVDRWKDMYISGGENVYPAEVEAAILTLAGVSEVAVVGVASERWGECGFAFVVRRPGAELSAEDVLGCCQQRLARYKHPAEVRFVDELPRTASGKVQKDVLRKAAQPR